jgi:hypothetical protein
MGRTRRKKAPAWPAVEAALAGLDRTALLTLISDLYGLSPDNHDFLHARFAIGDDVLEPYKRVIQASMYPDILNEAGTVDTERARRAIDQYAKAVHDPAGEAELRICLVEWGHRFTLDCGDIDEGFYDTLVEVFAEAAGRILALPGGKQAAFKQRLRKIVRTSDGIGWGYHDGLCDEYYIAFEEE